MMDAPQAPEEIMENPPPDSSAGSYIDLELEVAKNFEGDWSRFLRALQNPAEVLAFIRNVACNDDEQAFAEWMKEKNLPEAWLSRFHLALAELQTQADSNAQGSEGTADAATVAEVSSDNEPQS